MAISGNDTEKVLTPCGFDVTFNKTDARCYGEASGSATVVISGPPALGPYVIEWYNGSSSSTLNNLSKGTYFVKVTDNTGCFSNYFVTINEPPQMVLSFVKKDLRCFEMPEGEIDLTVTGGNPGAYSYDWKETGDNVEDLEKLSAGLYTVTVEDSKNCSVTDSIRLYQPTQLQSSYQVLHVKCHGGNDGEINLSVSGGVPVYSYSWSNGSSEQDVYDLEAGTHVVTITDDNGCQLVNSINVTQPLPITVSFEVTDVKCYNGEDGAIDLTVNGGTMPYSFVWSDREIVLGDVTEDLDSLKKNTYYVTITDANLCRYSDSVEVKESTLLITNVSGTDVTCYSGSDGAVDLTVTGGMRPYSYLWSNGSKSEDITNITAGTYSVTIADSNGCTGFATIQINQPSDLSMGFDIREVSCKDNDDGAVYLYTAGATPPYNYYWSNGVGSKDIHDVLGGIYTVQVVDAHGCSYSASVEVPVNPRNCITVVTVPNAFSPNGDDYNDVWVIRDYQLYPSIDVKVINEWGETVFTSSGYHEPWDGKRNGKDLPAGTYYYIINLGNGDPSFSGSVTIVR
ncbi:MAG TPA: gliding motility-associated C-terminal domain-containing protein [Cytophagaceae bacterium]